MVGWHHRLNGHEFEQAPRVGKGQGSLVCCSPCGCKTSDMTEQLNNNFLPSEAFLLHHNILQRPGPLPFYLASYVIKAYKSATGIGLPWCSSGWESSCQCRRHGARRSHMPQGNWASVPQLLNPCPLEPVLHHERSHHSEKLMHHNQRVAPTHCN